MPLIKSASPAAIGTNIREMQAAGHPHDQAVAAALHTADEAKHKGRKPQRHLKFGFAASARKGPGHVGR